MPRRRDGLYTRGKRKIYWFQWRGTRQSLRTTDRDAAELAAAEIQRRAASPSYSSAHETSVEQACDDFLKAYPTLHNRARPPSDGTVEMVGYHCGHFVRLFGAGTPLVRIDAATVTGYMRQRRDELIPGKRTRRKVSANTVAKELTTLRQVLRLAWQAKRFHEHPDRVVPRGVSPDYTPLERHVDRDQVDTLISHLSPERAAIVAFVVGVGADKCAIERAEPGDFALVRDAHGRVTGGDVLVRGTKNSRRWARVPVVEPFAPLVQQAHEWLTTHGAFSPWGNAVRDLTAACTRASLPRVTLRDLRRSYGRILRARGVPPSVIGGLLRHRDSRMAEIVYGGIDVQGLGRLATEAMAQAPKKKPKKPRKKASPPKP